MKILIIDGSSAFLDDIENRLLLSPLDHEVTVSSDINNIPDVIEETQPDRIVIDADILADEYWNYDIETIAYARNEESLNNILRDGFKAYGVINMAGKLVDAIDRNKTISLRKKDAEKASSADESKAKRSSQRRKKSQPKREKESDEDDDDAFLTGKATKRKSAADAGNREYDERNEEPERPERAEKRERKERAERRERTEKNTAKANREKPRTQRKKARKSQDYDDYDDGYDDYEDDDYYDDRPEPQRRRNRDDYYDDDEYVSVRDRVKERKRREAEMDERRRRKRNRDAEYAVDDDLGYHTKPAKVITCYSAKGGVGKTTLACEIAEFLAMMENGRSNYKVCLVDFNIDFGDVLNTLMLDPQGPNMTEWDANIKSRLQRGDDPDDITYTKEQIERYLQYDDDTGLAVLVAPISNEDSMDFDDEEFPIIVNNLKKYGGFDYVIFDTGNNTRDSSFIALQSSDAVYLVLTQSINAASDNGGLLSTIRMIGFDMNKIKLVINMARPSKAVNISVDEIIENFINPETDEPYEVAAVINYSTDVIKASNDGIPLVKDGKNEFTKQIAQIVSDLTQHEFSIPEPKKKGLFAKLFGR